MLKPVQTCVLLLCLNFEEMKGGGGGGGLNRIGLRFQPCASLVVSAKILVKKKKEKKKKKGTHVHIMVQWCKTVFLRKADVVVLP